MRVEIRKLHRRLGTTSVFVTHDQAEAMTLADKIVVMRAGYIEQVGTPAEVYSRPATRFVASFIGSPPMNLADGTINDEGAFVPAGDRNIALPLGRKDLAGRRVTFGIRPESLQPGNGPLAATVDFVEELGASRVLHLDWAGQLVLAVQSEGAPPAAGTVVHFGFAAEAVHLFSAEDGKRLDAPMAAAPAREYATA
jgi:sn-glycerol 3-phosphate transport system ATP-binding protein